jgi:predicted phage replisome organizer
MSDNQKYYYLKLKDNFFDQDNVKVLESLENGQIYSLIILKLYLKACKYDGQLKMTPLIPYTIDEKQINILAKVINHDADHVKNAIKQGINLGLISILETKEIWMTEIQNFIGHSSTEGDRKRKYRKKIEMGQMSDKRPPEIDIEKEIELEIEKEKDIESEKEKTFSEKSILNHWISKGLRNHSIDVVKKELNKKHKDIIKLYGEETIFQAIDN